MSSLIIIHLQVALDALLNLTHLAYSSLVNALRSKGPFDLTKVLILNWKPANSGLLLSEQTYLHENFDTTIQRHNLLNFL